MVANRKRRLLIVVNTISTFGGGEKFAFDLRNLLSKRFETTFTNPVSKSDIIREEESKLFNQFGIHKNEVHTIKCYGIRKKAFGNQEYVLMLPKPAGLVRLAGAIKNSDVVYCISNNPFLLIFSVLYAKIYGKRFIFGVHQPLFAKMFNSGGISAFVYKFILGQIKHFHVLNAYEQGLVNARYPNASTYLIPGFAYTLRNKPHKNNDFAVMFAGRQMKYEKGIDLLCDIMDRTIKKNRNIKFKVVGAKGDGEKLLKEIASRHNSNISLLGFVPTSRVMHEWATSNLAIFTSRNEELRYFPLVFLESQSFGLPIVTFMCKGAYSVMIDKDQGILVSDYDTEKAADAIIHYYRAFKKDKAGYFRMKQHISALNKELYGTQTILPKVIKMLDGSRSD